VLDGIEANHWADHEVKFPRRARIIPVGYNSIRSAALDAHVRGSLDSSQYRLGRKIESVAPTSVVVQGGETFAADVVIDARGLGTLPGLELAWQKFVGRTYRFRAAHGVRRPVIMDATVEQLDGYRFVYQLPISDTELLVEDTYYSGSPVLDKDALRSRLDIVAKGIGSEPESVSEECGVLPVVLGGQVASLWQGEHFPRIGVRGGFFHPTTSYSLPDAVANAGFLAEQKDLSGKSLYSLFRKRAERAWRRRSFFQLLNRMLYRAAEPDEAYRILEHFYRLPPEVISRFYAARLTALDKVRLLSGRPPVPIGRALGALRLSAA
jgi:lycopene beta-cyclase